MKRDYFTRLSIAARWYLPPAEAQEVLEDYRDIVGERSEEELWRDLGTPKAAVEQLVQLTAYQKWMTVFVILAGCVLLPAADVVLSELSQGMFTWFQIWFLLDGIAQTSRYAELMLPLGTVLALVWFQRNGRKEQTFPKRIVPLLLLLLLGMAWTSFLIWVVLTEQWDLLNSLFFGHTWMLRLTLSVDSFVMGAAGMLGLLEARLKDRRWRAVYILGLTGAVLCVFVWKVFSSMSPDFSSGWQTPLLMRYAFITVVGLIGTGVALC